MQFIHLRPAAVLIDTAGKPHLIRQREDLDYMESLERRPDHLIGG
jgi:hypothetical protein